MIAVIRLWFAALTRREQWLVGVAGALTAFVVAIFGILLPVLSTIDQAKIDHDKEYPRHESALAIQHAFTRP